MSVNDVSACGAVPLFFLDYLVVGKVVPERVADIVAGVDEGCLRAQCVLLGGETAEHPGHFKEDDAFDLAGFAVGLCRAAPSSGDRRTYKPGDALVGIASNGLHSNGFTLVRRLLDAKGVKLTDAFPGGDGATIGDVLLTPTTIYSPVLHDLGHAVPVHAAAHITGGGFPDNVGRILPGGGGGRARPVELAAAARLRLAARPGRGRRRDAGHLQLRPRHGPRRAGRRGAQGAGRDRPGRALGRRRRRGRCASRPAPPPSATRASCACEGVRPDRLRRAQPRPDLPPAGRRSRCGSELPPPGSERSISAAERAAVDDAARRHRGGAQRRRPGRQHRLARSRASATARR